MQGIWQRISQPFQQMPTEERLIVLAVVLACLVAIAVYVTQRIRGKVFSSSPPITDHLSEFRRMRDSGQLDDQEYTRVVQSISTIEQAEQAERGEVEGEPAPIADEPRAS